MDQARMTAAYRAIGLELFSGYVRMECNEARKVSRRGPEALATWAGKFYGRRLVLLVKALEPRVEGELARLGVQAEAVVLARTIATDYAARSKRELLALRGPDLEKQVERLTERMKLTRAAELEDAVVQAAATAAREARIRGTVQTWAAR